ncbi:hypothetical protein [Paenibacillus turpanensis]|uniref:hypothetical protein n=1 Tax=Paenibacillus turpanensis TaxID=2689078 RepID=UPI00140CF3B8|nr:hypothetical protein [Paenibacillus turpanensis]
MRASYKKMGVALVVGISVFCASAYIIKADNVLQTNEPGSVNDPVVTKSYVDEQIQKLTGIKPSTSTSSGAGASTSTSGLSAAEVRKLIQEELAKLPAQTNPSGSAAAPVAAPSTSGSDELKVVQMSTGQTLLAGAGSEFIVRSGKVYAYSNTENGIPDVTGGKDLSSGTQVPHNHLLIFPREGRGIKADAKNAGDVYVMVRGSYLLQNADGSTVSP